MSFDAQVVQLSDHIREVLGASFPEWPGGYPNEIESALLGAVFSIQARYGKPTTGVRAVVSRWRDHRGGQVDDLMALAQCNAADLAAVVANRSKASGRLKAELVVDAAVALGRAGLRSSSDFTASPEQRSAYLSVKGCGEVTWVYFGMLLGRPDVKADTWVVRFVREALDDQSITSEQARQLVVAAAKSSGVSASRLDHAVWLHARSR